MKIKEIVNALVRKYGSRDPFYLASCLGISVLDDEYSKNTLAYHLIAYRIHVVAINVNVDENLRKYIMAHELGHAILHSHIDTHYLKKNTLFSVDKIERQADTFAAELLIPDSLIREYREYTIYQIATMAGLPRELVFLKTYL